MLTSFFKTKHKDGDRGLTEKLIETYLASHETKKLQIGCGENNLPDQWLNTDLLVRNQKVAYLDAGKKFPFRSETFSFVYSEHIFEHLTFVQAKNMLSESFRILKKGGVIRIATPNIGFLIDLYQHPEKPVHKEYISWATKSFIRNISKDLEETDYSPVFVINNFFRDWGHQIIHNFESVELLLGKAGFVSIQHCEINKSTNPELANMERHGDGIPAEFNELETMVIEARKPEHT